MISYNHGFWIHTERLDALNERVKKMRDKFASFDTASIYQPRLTICKNTPPSTRSSAKGEQMVVYAKVEGKLPERDDTSNRKFLLWAKRWVTSLENKSEWEKLSPKHFSEWTKWPTFLYVKLASDYLKENEFQKTTDPEPTKDALIELVTSPDNKLKGKWASFIKSWEDDPLPDPILHPDEQLIINYFLAEEGKSPYLRKAKSLLSLPYFDIKNKDSLGLLASLPHVYRSRKQNKPIREHNEPFGNIKERGPLKLYLKRIDEKTMRRYPIVTYSFRDDFGRRFLWNASWPGEESLEEGKTYLLTGTISEHSVFKDKHYTHLKRCSGFKESSPSGPVPSFKAGAKKRPFKPHFNVELSIVNSDGVIDGNTYVLIERLWRENKKRREFKILEPIPSKSGITWEQMVANTINGISGLDRRDGLDPELDEEIIKALVPIQRLQSSISKNKGKWFLVDDAMGPELDHRLPPYPIPGDRSPSSMRVPRLFESMHAAKSHGKTLPCSRAYEVELPNTSTSIVPSMFHMKDPDAWKQFRKAAFDAGKNIFIYVDGALDIERYEPFMWHTLKHQAGFIVSTPQAVHKTFDKDHSKLLQGRRFVCVTGIEKDELAERVKDAWRQSVYKDKLWLHKIKADTVSHSNPREGGQFGPVTLKVIMETLVEPSAHRHHHLVVTDHIAAHYLRVYGATVIEIDVNTKSIRNGILLDWRKENIISLTNYVIDVVEST